MLYKLQTTNVSYLIFHKFFILFQSHSYEKTYNTITVNIIMGQEDTFVTYCYTYYVTGN